MSTSVFPIIHQHIYDRSSRPAGHCLRGGRRYDFVERLKMQPAKARNYVDIMTNEMLLRAQISAFQPDPVVGRRPGCGAALYFVECDVLALLQEQTVAELETVANTLKLRRATLVLRLYDGFESLVLKDDRARFGEAICRIHEQGVRFALGGACDPGYHVRLLQRLGVIDYLFLHLGSVPPITASAVQASHIGEMRDLMVEQINANSILFVASGMNTEHASELAKFLPFTYWMGNCLSASVRL